MNPTMKISVIVPFYNAEGSLARCVEALASQTRPADEIFFVDNASTDEGRFVLECFRTARPDVPLFILKEAKRGPSAARNRALAVATGDIVAFTDADAAASPGWLSTLEKLHAEGWDGIGGVYRFLEPKGVTAKLQAIQMEMPDVYSAKEIREKHDVLFGQMIGTCNASYRRDALAALGGFDEELAVGEDMDLTLRALKAGRRLVSWHPDAIVWHEPRKSLAQYWRRIFEYRTALPRLLKKHFPNEAIVCVPYFGMKRGKSPMPVMITDEFYLLVALAALAVFVAVARWVTLPLALALGAAALGVRFTLRMRRRARGLGLRVSGPELAGLAVSDFVQKIFSECGRIYGSLKERVLYL